MRFPRVVPWASAAEWKQLYRNFYPESFDIRATNIEDKSFIIDLQQKALKRSRTWQSRGRCPISVESTAALIEAQLTDRRAKSATESCDLNLRLIYSIAIIRFVNGLVDQQQQAMYAMPIVQLAQTINLPRYFVDIRHAATHDQLPSLVLLRKAAKDALKWLEENYWSIQDSYVDDLRNTCLEMLVQFKNSRKSDFKEGINGALSDGSNQLIKEICGICPASLLREILIPSLVEQPGMLVPLNKKKRSSDPCEIPPALIDLWQPLLERIGSRYSAFYEELFQALLATTNRLEMDNSSSSEPSTSQLSTLTGWAVHIMRCLLDKSADRSTIEDLLESLLHLPSRFTSAVVIKMILPRLPSDSSKQRAKNLANLASNMFARLPVKQEQEERTASEEVNDLIERSNRLLSSLKSGSLPDTGGAVKSEFRSAQERWQMCESKYWETGCALGTIPVSLAKERGLDGEIVRWNHTSVRLSTISPIEIAALDASVGILPDME